MLGKCVFFFVFFFKQKTAYEMRISDWSSDVCSSDLELVEGDGGIRVACLITAEAVDAQLVRPHQEICTWGLRETDQLLGGEGRLQRPSSSQDDDLADLAGAQLGPGMVGDVGLRQCFRVADHRSEDRRVGYEVVSTGRSGWSRDH